jgi:hypothetical protein
VFEGRNSPVQNSCKYVPCRYVGRFLFCPQLAAYVLACYYSVCSLGGGEVL